MKKRIDRVVFTALILIFTFSFHVRANKALIQIGVDSALAENWEDTDDISLEESEMEGNAYFTEDDMAESETDFDWKEGELEENSAFLEDSSQESDIEFNPKWEDEEEEDLDSPTEE